MNKNRAFKALALGSASSLLMSGLLALPANAADPKLTTRALAGTSQSSFVGAGFLFRTSVANAGDGVEVAYLVDGYEEIVEDGGSVWVEYDVVDSLAGYASEDFAYEWDEGWTDTLDVEQNDNDEWVTEPIYLDSDDPHAVVSVVVFYGDEAEGTREITLTPFVNYGSEDPVDYDADVDGAKGAPFKINYLDPATVKATATVVNDLDANESEVAFSFNGVNNASIWQNPYDGIAKVEAYVNGEWVDDVYVGEDDYSAADGAFIAITNPGLSAGDVITHRIYIQDEEDVQDKPAATVRQDLSDSDVDYLSGVEVDLFTNPIVIDEEDHTYGDEFDDYAIRSGSGSFTVTVDAFDSDDLGVAGEVISWTITNETGFDNTKGAVTAGGKTLSRTVDKNIKVTSTTNADGTASLTISYASLLDGEEISVEGVSLASGNASGTYYFEAYDAVVYEMFGMNANDDGAMVAEVGDSIKFNLALRDEFGLAPSGSYRVRYEITDDGGELAEDISGWATFTNGSGSVTLEEGETLEAGEIYFEDEGDWVQKKNAAGLWVDVDLGEGGYTSESGPDIIIVDEKTSVAKIEFIGDWDATTDSVAILGEKLLTIDGRVNANVSADDDLDDLAELAYDRATVGENYLEVQTYDSDNLEATGGNAVTFSSADVMFIDEDYELFGNGSLTVYTDEYGYAEVYFASNKAGKHTVTVTSNGKSDTITIVVDAADSESGVEWIVSAPTSVAPASTFVYTATLVDDWGNPVQTDDNTVDVTYDGPGLISGDLPEETNSKGQVRLAVLLGASDVGKTITVNVVHDDVNEIEAKEYTIKVGAVNTALNAGSFNGYIAVYAKGYKGATLSWKIAGKWFKTTVTSDYQVFQRKTAAVGTKVNVELYINGVKSFTKQVTTR